MGRVRFRDSAGSVRTGELSDTTITSAGQSFEREDVDLLPPVQPNKVIGVARNYHYTYDDTDDAPPDHPQIWLKGDRSVLAGPNDTVSLPGNAIYEAELGVVIGKECRNVSAADATDYIGGYTCANDITLTDAPHDGFFWSKSFDNAAVLGPVVAAPEDVNEEEPHIQLWLNGEKRQDSTGESYVHSVTEVVSAISEQLTLYPDDVIMMSTPPGLDTLSPGDHVRIEIEGIGTLEHDVAED